MKDIMFQPSCGHHQVWWWMHEVIIRSDDECMTVETCCLSWPSYVNKSMYCSADVHFIVFYLLALRDAFSKVQCGVEPWDSVTLLSSSQYQIIATAVQYILIASVYTSAVWRDSWECSLFRSRSTTRMSTCN